MIHPSPYRLLGWCFSAFVLSLCLWLPAAPPAAQAVRQGNSPAIIAPLSAQRDFITTFAASAAPATHTRSATAAETPQLAQRRFEPTATTPSLHRVAAPQDGFSVAFRGTAQLEAYPPAKAALQRALERWENLRAPDSVQVAAIEINVDFGTRLFDAAFPTAQTAAVTTLPEESIFYSTLLTELREGGFDPEQARLLAALPPARVPNEVGEAQTVLLTAPQLQALGRPPLRPLRASLGFNAAAPFDFDPRDGISPERLDFEALVLRELCRIFGLYSRVENAVANWSGEPVGTLWDLYRFRPTSTRKPAAEMLATEPRVIYPGGEQVFFVGGAVVPLSTGSRDGELGDGNLAGHWKDDALTGRYLGLLDPTLATGERGGFTAYDLTALRALGYQLSVAAQVMEVLSVDDGSREAELPLTSGLVVNRLSPTRYPATVDAVRVDLPNLSDTTALPKPLRIVVFADPARTGQPPAKPTLLYDRTINVGGTSAQRGLEIMLDPPVKLTAGDLYIGVQSSLNEVKVGLDSGGNPGNSAPVSSAISSSASTFISTDNGASFQPLLVNQQPATALLRAVCQEAFFTPSVPQLSALSPNAAAPGSQPLELLVYGEHFAARDEAFDALSVVRWNGVPRPTSYLNGGLLRITLTQADLAQAGTARVTVFTPTAAGGYESAPLEFKIAAQAPVPQLLALTPDFAVPGSELVPLTLYGRNFAPTSSVRWNGQPRAVTFKSSTELEASLNVTDFAAAGTVAVTVFTPDAGGGTTGQTSNALNFRRAPCSYKVFASPQAVSGQGGVGGVLLETERSCLWTVTTATPWLRARGAWTGQGQAMISFNAATNTSEALRVGELKVAGQSVQIRQRARLVGASSAYAIRSVPLGGIGTLYSAGVTVGAQSATQTPLPTTLAGVQVRLIDAGGSVFSPPLFYVGPGQINLLMPDEVQLPMNEFVSLKSINAEIFQNGAFVADGFVDVERVAPGLFTSNPGGQGVAAGVALRIRADGTQSYEPLGVYDSALKRIVTNPLSLGPPTDQVFLLLFGSGLRNRPALSSVQAFIGATSLPVLYAGPQGQLAGLDQVNLQLPRNLVGVGEVRVRVVVNELGTNTASIAIRGGE